MNGQDYILEMKGVSKFFTGVRANYRVDLQVKKGEVMALLGENGAGKTTLMNILYGLYAPSEGEIFFDGRKVRIRNPQDAIKLGIGMVHQHFMQAQALSVIENVVLGMHGPKSPRLDLNASAKQLMELADRYNMEIDPYAKIWQLSVGQQQRVEILKALYRGAKFLIFDEPTAVLTPQEVEGLFDMIRLLKSEGNTVIFISHKLNEVLTICDRISVLRLGENKAVVNASDITKEELASLMVGRLLNSERHREDTNKFTEEVLRIKNVSCFNVKGVQALKKIDLTVKAGEILGIAGVDGNGQKELAEVITGLTKVTEGTVMVNGEDVTNAAPLELWKKGVSHIPEDRLRRGVVASMDLVENDLLTNHYQPEFSKGPFVNWNAIEKDTEEIIKDYKVKTSGPHELMKNLSGGNQQKMVMGRALIREPKLLLALHPTRGLDIGATEYIQQCIMKERNKGTAVLMVSTELEEILALSDRIAVMYEGNIIGIVPPDTPVETIGLMMAGVCPEDAEKKKEDVAEKAENNSGSAEKSV